MVLHTDQALPREVREQLREQWNNRHRGPSRAGEVAVLSNGLKVDTVSATNQESQLAELWMQSLLAVCRIWKMPPHMIQELGRATWGNLASEMVSFEKFTIQPWLRRIEGAIERDILDDQDDLYAEFLVEGLLRSDITTRYQAYEVAIRNGWMTREEVRKKENLGMLPNQDEPDSLGDGFDDTDSTQDDMTAGVAAGGPDLQEQALNGAQVSSLLEILGNLAGGLLTPAGAKALISGAFPTMPEQTVDSIIAGVNEGVTPSNQQALGDNANGP